MEMPNLSDVASRARFMREAGIALLLASLLLAVFIFVPLAPVAEREALAEAEQVPDPYANVPLVAKAAIVYDLTTDETLYEKNADAQLPLASLIKLLAVESAVRVLPPELPITITIEDTRVDSPHRFRAGDTLTFFDLARLTLTASLNDGASAIIRALALRQGTTTPAALQTAAVALGLTSTYAINGNGLDLSPLVAGGYGSARDVAVLAGALVADAPQIALATTLPKAEATTEGGKHYQILNTNPTVSAAPRLLLSKTGFTDLAGGNLVIVFDASIGHPIAIVVLGSTEEERFTDATALTAATLALLAGVASL